MLAACLVLLITGQTDLPHHHWQETSPRIAEAIRTHTSCEVKTIEDARAITAEALRDVSALVVNYNGPRLISQQEKAIEAFVRRGGGLVAFHQALYGEWFGHRQNAQGRWEQGSGSGWREWSVMLGASWNPAKLGHARRGAFEVKCSEPAICGASSFTANDELYHGFTLTKSAVTVATAMSSKAAGGTGEIEPVAWTNTYGLGRVFFTTLGHDATALFQHGERELFVHGITWAARSKLVIETKKPIRVLVVTGGHTYPETFYALWNEMPGIEWRHVQSHSDLVRRKRDEYDLLVLHDMIERVTPASREWLKAWIDAGKGVVSMHHAVVNYTDWPWWWQEVTGVKFFTAPLGEHKKSSYKEDIEFAVTPARGKQAHPVLAGVPPLVVEDETYRGMWFAPSIEILMETDHPEGDRPVVFVGPTRQARVVTIQIGHSASTFLNPGYQRLVKNAMEWTAAATQSGGNGK